MNYRGSTALSVLGLCCSTVLALACNAEDSNNKGRKDTPAPTDVSSSDVAPVQRETCDDNPLLAGCPAVTPAPGASSAATGPTTAPAAAAPKSDPAALAKAAAENVLASNCGQCHGPALTPDQAKAGMNYINDIDQLVATGKIVPLDSAGSRVVQRMVKGEMPPVSSGLPRVTDADIQTVASYIDNPVFWPQDVQPGDCADKGQLTDFDTLFQTASLDLRRQDSKDQPFLRYISLTNRFTAGVCADGGLDKDRQGLTKMLNMLSVDAVIREPTAIDKDKTLYRIDLRDLNWDRAISVNGKNFNDVWEAIAANNPYAVKFVGDDADALEGDAKTDFPIMMADQMMDVAVIGNLYYGIIAVDVNQPLANFISNDLGIDLQANLDDRRQLRAGTTRSRISRQDRLVERDDIEVRSGALWQSFDFEADAANDSIFQDPFGFAPGGTEAIFTLPNGMLGFIIADANDNIVEDSDILLDTNQDNFRAVTAVSCSNCHSVGLIPVVDEWPPRIWPTPARSA
jgi:serine/threonine-protein kinase